MSRKIDLSNPESLTKADRLYLQERGQHIALGIPAIRQARRGSEPVEYTGDAVTAEPDGGTGETNLDYDAMTVAALKQEVESRNEDRPDDAKLSTGGNKADLIARLRADDDADEIIEE